MKKLTRSQDRMIAGVLAGIAHYYEIDPTVVRLGYVLFSVFTCFSGILFYLLAWVIIPESTKDCAPCETKQKTSNEIDSMDHKDSVSQTNNTNEEKHSETHETSEDADNLKESK